MNVFLPYENDVVASVQSLDDVRLNKQAVECYQLLTSAVKERNGVPIKGHRNHPIYVFYKNNLEFLAYYGYRCCEEYQERFGKEHSLEGYFFECLKNLDVTMITFSGNICFDVVQPKYTPYYMEGSKGQPNYIRTTENVSVLFQSKLCKKWDADKEKGRPPRWTNRNIPDFYIKYLQEEKEYDS